MQNMTNSDEHFMVVTKAVALYRKNFNLIGISSSTSRFMKCSDDTST